MASYHRQKLTAAQQYWVLQRNPVCCGSGRLHCGKLVWEFEVTPTPISRTYRLRIEYQQGATPAVVVVEPDLSVLAEGRALPHVYEQHPARLCLYLPKAREWTSEVIIATSIVPWAYLWLFYFEEWLLSNEWKGGGEHPKATDDRKHKKNLSN